MEILKYADADTRLLKILQRNFEIDETISAQVKEIIAGIKSGRNKALMEYTKRFDHFNLTLENMMVTKDYFKECLSKVPSSLITILKEAKDNITGYHNNQILKTWEKEFAHGVRLGQKITPIQKVGVYVPGGKAFYPSTMLMNIIPAQIAGVEEIIVVTPPGNFYENPLLGATLEICGIEKAYLIGGAQAIAALAFGTESVPKVNKIVGPGNIYVSLAKREVFGYVDIDMIAGPSEIVVLADDSANPEWVALDLLSQSEHRTGFESSILVTDSSGFAEEVNRYIDKHLTGNEHEAMIRTILQRYGAIIIVDSMNEGAEVVNLIAPEHLEIIVKDEKAILDKIKNAGAIFIGPYSSESVGDYWAGPNHVLPTGGTAKFFSPLGVYDFCKKSSLIYYTKEALLLHAKKINTLALEEDLFFHGKAVLQRYEDLTQDQ
ncbi:MAG: histidinol dehydrogenase [Spirochaetales bacterium]|nr:histidinol dehydrogenase [Spirochaetales bacterium]